MHCNKFSGPDINTCHTAQGVIHVLSVQATLTRLITIQSFILYFSLSEPECQYIDSILNSIYDNV